MSYNAKVLLAILLLGIGAVGGFLNTQDYYQSRLDEVNKKLATAEGGRNNLEALATEQGLKLGELVAKGNERAQAAQEAQEQAHKEARPDYEAANRIQLGRIGGNQCEAATAVIDQELFEL